MIVHNGALKKGSKVAGHNIQSWAKRRRRGGSLNECGIRYFASGSDPNNQSKGEADQSCPKPAILQQVARKTNSIGRDFFLSVLGSSATKRDARSYLQAFTPAKEATTPTKEEPTVSKKSSTYANGVNLGGFYGKARAMAESPKFVQPTGKREPKTVEPPLHIALVKIRDPQNLDDHVLDGVTRTLSQLGHLGLATAVVVDCGDVQTDNMDQATRSIAVQQADRIVRAIDSHGNPGARVVDNAIGVSNKSLADSVWVQGRAYVSFRKLLLTPLKRGMIPVIPAIGFTDVTQKAVVLEADEVVLALTRELAGLQPMLQPDKDPMKVHDDLKALQSEVSLDRLIILDPLGGIPSTERPNGYHVFLNMEQEYEPARQDLLRFTDPTTSAVFSKTRTKENLAQSLSKSIFSKFVKHDISDNETSMNQEMAQQVSNGSSQHIRNLDLVRKVLSILPPTSSALLTTPEEAANSGRLPELPFQATGVGTRRQRNPLIHNLLTDKPAFSSSLPVGRLGPTASTTNNEPISLLTTITPTTFAKHGMSITIFPDPQISPWEPPSKEKPGLSLTDSEIDLPRLVHLIEDSFNRKLDAEHFLNRVKGRIAGVIVAGEYEGGALLTWELPPGVPDDGSPESRARMVPYLDKFAVLKRSQGSGGVADIVFTAMVRDCFPTGVCWRSRRTNPVNKWYFERSRGTWKLNDSNWTLFWTTPDQDLDKQKFLDYEAVCRGVVPSWADVKGVVD